MLAIVGCIVIVTTWYLAREWTRVEPQSVPIEFEIPDFSAIEGTAERKREFFAFVKPYVDQINSELATHRAILENAREKLVAGKALDTAEQIALPVLAQRYDVPLAEPPSVEFLDALLMRVDVLPPSMVLAQAASESAWGTSRFARRGNALFGQWCYKDDCGLVPARRSDDAAHQVRRFKTVMDSVRAYFRNINTHWAYRPLRRMRAELRRETGVLRGVELAEGLVRYSERREAYVEEIRNIIRTNKLGSLDQTASL
jgi:Bax protein